jgi:hypothetical protein
MVALNPHTEETRESTFDYDRVVWDPAYRREVIERLKRDDAADRAASAQEYDH